MKTKKKRLKSTKILVSFIHEYSLKYPAQASNIYLKS